MQIINTVDIICGVCGKDLPVEVNVGFEPKTGKHIFRVHPCECVERNENIVDRIQELTERRLGKRSQGRGK